MRLLGKLLEIKIAWIISKSSLGNTLLC